MAVAVDLSKAFDSINHNLLLAKLKAYGLSQSKVCASQAFLKSQTLCFVSGSSFLSLSYLYTVSSKRFSTPFLPQSRIIVKTFCKTASLS